MLSCLQQFVYQYSMQNVVRHTPLPHKALFWQQHEDNCGSHSNNSCQPFTVSLQHVDHKRLSENLYKLIRAVVWVSSLYEPANTTRWAKTKHHTSQMVTLRWHAVSTSYAVLCCNFPNLLIHGGKASLTCFLRYTTWHYTKLYISIHASIHGKMQHNVTGAL